MAVVLVLDMSANDVNTNGIANIKSVSVVSESVPGAVVNSDALEGQPLGSVDAENLHERILDGDIVDV